MKEKEKESLFFIYKQLREGSSLKVNLNKKNRFGLVLAEDSDSLK